jgi:glycosyltransferase involved in cell wall biosynthesis
MPPLLSIVLPFYDEEECVEEVVGAVRGELERSGVSFEIVAVQNGSRDRTGPILARLAREHKAVRVVAVPVNRGFGDGILRGLTECAGDIVGYMPGDGQVPPAVLCRLLRRMDETQADIGKGRRTVRRDGWHRKAVSHAYNTLMKVGFGVPFDDVNGHPKLLTRRAYLALRLRSADNFIDAELVLKAQRLGLATCEVDFEFEQRRTGRSTVRWTTCVQFLVNLARARLPFADPWGLSALPRADRPRR